MKLESKSMEEDKYYLQLPTEKLERLKDRNRNLEEEYKQTMQTVEQFAAGIEDQVTRKAITERFIYGEKWEKIAIDLGGIYSGDYVRLLIVSKYLKDQGIK